MTGKKLPPHPRPAQKGGPYALFLTNEDTGDVVLDLHGIPEHVVSQIALFVGKAMPLARAAAAGVAAVRALSEVGSALQGAINGLQPMPPARRRASARGRR